MFLLFETDKNTSFVGVAAIVKLVRGDHLNGTEISEDCSKRYRLVSFVSIGSL